MLGLAVAVAAVGGLLRPVLAGVTVAFGAVGLLLVGVLSQAVVLDVAIAVAPGVHLPGAWHVLLVSWGAAAVAAVVTWLADAGSDDAYLDQLLGQAVKTSRRTAPTPVDGRRLLVVQLDGVGEHVLRQALTAGQVPALDAWLHRGSHVLRGWHTGLPSTTPAAQAVLLHGDDTEVPSYRWFEKETGRERGAALPAEAAEIESRISDGRGLLCDGGVSVSNLFSGDAAVRLLTLSDARLPARGTGGLVSLARTRGGLVRALVVGVRELTVELVQGSRQRRRDVRPRTRRDLVRALERGALALLRDLTVAIVADQLARGAPTVYVDLVGYDDVAHHAGPTRTESMEVLDELDRLLALFADVAHETGRDYDIAVVSDHGQAQGATFRQLSGVPLATAVAGLVPRPCAVVGPPAEVAATGRAPAAFHGQPAGLLLRPRPVPTGTGAGPHTAEPSVVVTVAGNLAHLYLRHEPGRVVRSGVEAHLPGLLAGLAAHPYVGAVLVRESASRLVVLGPAGWRALTATGPADGEGTDPTAVFGPHAPRDLWDLDRRHHVGDVVLLGRYDPVSGEVAAFEELVGSHGGLGGGQTEAVLVHPAAWAVPTGLLRGADVHRLLAAARPAVRSAVQR